MLLVLELGVTSSNNNNNSCVYVNINLFKQKKLKKNYMRALN